MPVSASRRFRRTRSMTTACASPSAASCSSCITARARRTTTPGCGVRRRRRVRAASLQGRDGRPHLGVVSVGGVVFELHHCKGETDDHTWVWCPERGVLCPGDLFIWAVPNDGNPQKVQRYPWERAKGLREMAALKPYAL